MAFRSSSRSGFATCRKRHLLRPPSLLPSQCLFDGAHHQPGWIFTDLLDFAFWLFPIYQPRLRLQALVLAGRASRQAGQHRPCQCPPTSVNCHALCFALRRPPSYVGLYPAPPSSLPGAPWPANSCRIGMFRVSCR